MTVASPDTWARLAELPLTIESYDFERLSREFAYGHERVTTLIRLRGGGREGLGEDVSPHESEDYTLHVTAPRVRRSPASGRSSPSATTWPRSTSGRCRRTGT